MHRLELSLSHHWLPALSTGPNTATNVHSAGTENDSECCLSYGLAGGTPFETVLPFRVAWVFEGAVRVVEHTSVQHYCQAMKVPVVGANFVGLADPPLFFYLSFRRQPQKNSVPLTVPLKLRLGRISACFDGLPRRLSYSKY